MKYVTLIVLINVFLPDYSAAQDSFYDYLSMGNYTVIYSDTVIFDENIDYKQYGYSGAAPLFLKIWYPSADEEADSHLPFHEFVEHKVPNSLEGVYDTLKAQMYDILFRDGLEYSLDTAEPIDYGNKDPAELLHYIMQLKTKSISSALRLKMNFPVVVYHHGSQGLSYENSIMAEFLASHGYIFISSNFHHPYPNTVYGLLPYKLEQLNKHDQSSAKRVLQFARTLTDNENVFFVGHSWGAQEGWCFLHQKGKAKAFVSMETTLEYKDDEIVKEMWPYVYDALKVRRNTFSLPILSFAAEDESVSFDFFKGINSERSVFASYKDSFSHNSYTSMIFLRYFVRNQMPVPDQKELESQMLAYIRHLNFIHAFLESIKNKKYLNVRDWEDYFTLELDR
jgi:pimeloyl-ACP methyl ester carboxylesterase